MRLLTPIALLLALGLSVFPMHGAEISPFSTFNGDYLTGGTAKISDGGAAPASGQAKIRLTTTADGRRTKLKIHATIELPDADRSLSSTITFKRKHHAVISNLAPGVDDGHLANGAYSVSPRRITAEFPFTIGTVTGRTTLQIRLVKRAQGNQIIVVQTLFTSALARPITWTFKATSAGS